MAEQLARKKVDALLVSSPANIRYLTGYAGSNGLVLITPGEEHFLTDPRYGAEASSTITCKVHVCRGELVNAAAGILKRKKFRKLGYEPAWMRMDRFGELHKACPAVPGQFRCPAL